MEKSLCSYCGSEMVTERRLQCVGKIQKGPGRADGIRRPRRREIPRIVVEVDVCSSCRSRDVRERRDRNTPARWLAYVKDNPLYFESIYGRRDPVAVASLLFQGGGISDVPVKGTKKPRRVQVYAQAAAN